MLQFQALQQYAREEDHHQTPVFMIASREHLVIEISHSPAAQQNVIARVQKGSKSWLLDIAISILTWGPLIWQQCEVFSYRQFRPKLKSEPDKKSRLFCRTKQASPQLFFALRDYSTHPTYLVCVTTPAGETRRRVLRHRSQMCSTLNYGLFLRDLEAIT